MSEDQDTLLQFPCRFPIKAMGRAEPGFDALIVALIRRHAPDLSEAAVVTRESRNGRWLSVTVTITATSKVQLDRIYEDLSAHEKVVISL